MSHFSTYLQIRIKLREDLHFVIYGAGMEKKDSEKADNNGFVKANKNEKRPIILYSKDFIGNTPTEKIQIFETKKYRWAIESDNRKDIPSDITVMSSLLAYRGFWEFDKYGISGSFKSINYLGSAKIIIKKNNVWQKEILFEIIPIKLNFENEYRAMIEFIAEQCQQILLQIGSPVFFNISNVNSNSESILIEQFLFLRYVLKPEKLNYFFEAIKRNPDCSLKVESVWKTLYDCNNPDFYNNPSLKGRHWYKTTHTAGRLFNGLLPNEINSTHKHETFNTPANRFLKYALETFLSICEKIIYFFSNEKNKKMGGNGIILKEAEEMRNELNAFMSLSFLKDVGKLTNIPFNNQVIQKREGYRDILQAWILLDTASQLDWDGRDDVYDGSSKNAAILYEYWLYFVLYTIFRNEPDYDLVKDNTNFIEIKNNGLSVNLKKGKTTQCIFKTAGFTNKLNIHLYYNKTFPSNVDNVLTAGSYSSNFTPDYTLALFPESFNSIIEAEKVGKATYIHFDAKYRIEQYNQVFDSENLHDQRKISNSYKPNDIYKMHTYNEAIRRSAGSYILYPGNDPIKKKEFRKYRELLPGVGAFAVKPIFNENGIPSIQGINTLKSFIKKVINFQQSKMTQNYRVNFWTHDTIKDADIINIKKTQILPSFDYPAKDTYILLGFIRKDDIDFIENNCIFFFHAVNKQNKPLQLDKNIYKAKYFIGFTHTNYNQPFIFINKIWKIISPPTLILSDELKQSGKKTNPSVNFYYKIALKEATEINKFTHITLEQFRKLNPDINQYSPKVICWQELLKKF